MKILITGSTGLIGSRLVSVLNKSNHQVLRMVRRAPVQANEVRWDPNAGTLDTSALEGLDAVVHLAGESIASGRWTAEKKRRIRNSRIQGTKLLAQSLAKASDPPKVLISVSAVGYYGDRGEEELDEKSGSGSGFLADVCREWEGATIASELTRAGYQTCWVGRSMHQTPPRKRYGFEQMVVNDHRIPFDDYDAWLQRQQPEGSGGYYGTGVMHNDWTARPWHLPEACHHTNWAVNLALDFLRRRDPTCPFFLVRNCCPARQPKASALEWAFVYCPVTGQDMDIQMIYLFLK